MTKTETKKNYLRRKKSLGKNVNRINWKEIVALWNNNRELKKDTVVSGRHGRKQDYVPIPKKAKTVTGQKSSLVNNKLKERASTSYADEPHLGIICDVKVPALSKRTCTLKFREKETETGIHKTRTVKHPWRPDIFYTPKAVQAGSFENSKNLLDRSQVTRKKKLVASYLPVPPVLQATKIPIKRRDQDQKGVNKISDRK